MTAFYYFCGSLVALVFGFMVYAAYNPDPEMRAMFDAQGRCQAMGGSALRKPEIKTVECYRMTRMHDKIELYFIFKEKYGE